MHNQEADSGKMRAENHSSLPGSGVIPPSYAPLYANGSAEGRGHLPGCEVSPTSFSALYTNGSAEGRSPLPECGVSPHPPSLKQGS